MKTIKIIAISVLLFFSSWIYAQNGIIRGTVFDDATGELLPGVTIYIEKIAHGTTTDLDGKFNLSVAPGTYSLKISFISYQTVNMENISVKSGEVIVLKDVGLKETSIEIASVVVTAQAVRNTETSMMAIKSKSPNMLDGISAMSLRKTGDSDAASSIKRVTGVSVSSGKYVYVRGLGDRYTKTILNGLDIPGLDPDRNTLQIDIFPTNIIDNIIVHKSFSAELPADFTGGIIDIEIKDFPEERKADISFSMGYNSNSHFNSDYLTYEGGKTDFLGFDDGTRSIPATTDVPFFAEVVGNPNGAKADRYKEILGNFNTTMAASNQTSFMDYSFGATYGNQKLVKKFTIGYNIALSYKSKTEFYKNAEFGRYGLSGDPGIYEMDRREYQVGDYGVSDVLLSGLAGFAIKTKKSKYRIMLLHLQNGESKAGIFDYIGSDQGSNFESYQHNLDYSQRSLTNVLIDGKHKSEGSKWTIEWKLSPTLSVIEDPDIRFTRYRTTESGNVSIGTESGFPERIWRSLQEINLAGGLHISKEFQFLKRKSEFKFGGAYTYKQRDFEVMKYVINTRSVSLTGDPNELFADENLWPLNGDPRYGTTYEAGFIPNNANQFNSNVQYAAAYVSTKISLTEKFKAVLGVRAENYTQRYTGANQQRTIILNNDIVLDDLKFFPSVNLIYSINDKQNLRFSYSKTIARPSFKELSYAEIFDPVSGRAFIGGLFRDANDVAGIVYWDGNLVSTDIFNYDLRWELFLERGQTVSVSGFYKTFKNPIEMVQFATQTGSFQPRNVGDGQVYGIEVEFRKNLDFLGESFKNITLSSNASYIESRIELSSTEYDSRVANARTGQEIEKYRDMAGQAPYLINAGLLIDSFEKGFWNGFEAGLFYNVQGSTLQFVGINDRPDIYSKPFHSLNLNMSKSFKNGMDVGFKVQNILNSKEESVFKSFRTEDQYFTRLEKGISLALSLKYKF
jgi:hypothetical protein